MPPAEQEYNNRHTLPMKLNLQIRLGQQLAMTPQLQQAIRLLQLSTLELQTEVQDALDSNLMLEREDDQEQRAVNEQPLDAATQERESEVSPVDIPEQLAVDSVWEDVYEASVAGISGNGPAEGVDMDFQSSGTESLQDHLYEQLNLVNLSDTDLMIALAVIDSIDDDGYLLASLDEIHASLPDQEPEIGLDEVHAQLSLIQSFDPPGVGAPDLATCLGIQLEQLDPDTPWRQPALQLVSEYLELLGTRDYASLMRQLRVEKNELQEIIDLIQSLHPRPGSLIASSTAPYVIPDVYVRKINDVWKVELNPEAMPKVRINTQYANMIRRADSSNDNTTMKSHLQEARWFIKSLRSRSETLLKVATCIVDRQRGFLEYGDEAMKPMVLHDIAEVVNMHESTISRVTTNKYMHTPRGIYELKFFFSSHVFMKSGAECSSTAIRALLKKLIAAENSLKPLSDSKLATILSDQGINVARRTVAKYRESMSIPSSTERKELV